MKICGKAGLRILVIVSGLVMGTLSLQAGGNMHFRGVEEGEAAALFCISDQPADIRIRIESMDGTTVYFTDREKQTEAYRKLLRFSDLADGDYRLVASIDKEIRIREFTISDNRVYVKSDTPVVIRTSEPVFLQTGKYLVCHAERGNAAQVSISFEKEGEFFFEDHTYRAEGLHKKYNLEYLPEGEYTALVRIGDQSYSCNFIKE